jgi:aminoglycoside phosphotransferase (APT) family kinase protein
MRSISKTPLTPETIQRIVAHHFGASSRLITTEELTDGFYNAAHWIALADGLRCVLKVAPPASVRVLRYEHDIMTAEVETIRLVRARTSLPAPEVLCHDASRTLIDSEFFIMAFVPGTPFHKLRASLSQEDQQRIVRRIGAFLAEMNGIAGPAFGYFARSSPRFAAWRDAFDAMMEVNFGAFAALAPDSPLLAGDGRPMLVTPEERVRRTLYNLYLFLIMIIECTYRRYPTQDQENWVRRLLPVELEKLQAAHRT